MTSPYSVASPSLMGESSEVGREFGVTRERIRQLQNTALIKMRRALSKKEKPLPAHFKASMAHA